MNLNIESLQWVIPGVVGLWNYNKWRPVKAGQLAGWEYVFAVVIFSTFSIYLSSLVFSLFNLKTPSDFGSWFLILSCFVSGLFGFFLSKIFFIFDLISSDPFFESCSYWHKKQVFITLKNSKVYVGYLLDYTNNPQLETTIKIAPVFSGVRGDDGNVSWTTTYPVEDVEEPIVLIFPIREAINFSLWKGEYFKGNPK